MIRWYSKPKSIATFSVQVFILSPKRRQCRDFTVKLRVRFWPAMGPKTGRNKDRPQNDPKIEPCILLFKPLNCSKNELYSSIFGSIWGRSLLRPVFTPIGGRNPTLSFAMLWLSRLVFDDAWFNFSPQAKPRARRWRSRRFQTHVCCSGRCKWHRQETESKSNESNSNECNWLNKRLFWCLSVREVWFASVWSVVSAVEPVEHVRHYKVRVLRLCHFCIPE